MSDLKITDTDSRNGMVVVNLVDSAGSHHSVILSSIDVASLMGSLRLSLEEAVNHPSSVSVGLPGMQRVQYAETSDAVYFRIFLSDRLFHEYPVPRDTTLAAELKLFADRVEARNAAKATHKPPTRAN